MKSILLFLLFVILIITSPFWVRLGEEKIVKEWRQPQSIDYGLKRKLMLRIYRYNYYVDFFNEYYEYYIYIGDGGYGKVKYYNFSDLDIITDYFNKCKVSWMPKKIRFQEPNGFVLEIPI